MEKEYKLAFSVLFLATSHLLLKAGERVEGYLSLGIGLVFLFAYVFGLLRSYFARKPAW